MRGLLISGFLILLAAPPLSAGPFQRRVTTPQPVSSARFPRIAALIRASNSESQGFTPRGPLPPQRFPRVAALAMPGGAWTPGYYSPPVRPGGITRTVPRMVAGALYVIGYIPTPFYPIGTGVTGAIRVAHVSMNGSPTPGMPLDTLIWIASPWAAKVRDNLRNRRLEQGLAPLIGRTPPPVVPVPHITGCPCGQ